MDYECEMCGSVYTGKNNLHSLGVSICSNCIKYPESKRFIETKLGKAIDIDSISSTDEKDDSQQISSPNTTKANPHPITSALYLLGIISIIAGLYLVITSSSLIWFYAGFTQAAFFAAFGKCLDYLKQIAENTKR